MTVNGVFVRRARVVFALVVLVGTVSLAGCRPSGVDLDPKSFDLEPCPQREIRVEDLPDIGQPGCDLALSTIVFEGDYFDYSLRWGAEGDRSTEEIPSIGTVTAPQTGQGDKKRELLIVNWGIPGAGVASIEGGKPRAVWATSPEAEELQYRQLEVEGVDVD